SEIIAKDYFDLPPRDIQDAWCYPSILSRQNFNVCFRPDIAKEALHLRGAWCVIRKESAEGFEIRSVAICNSRKEFEYFAIGSAEQLESFPEISRPKTDTTEV